MAPLSCGRSSRRLRAAASYLLAFILGGLFALPSTRLSASSLCGALAPPGPALSQSSSGGPKAVDVRGMSELDIFKKFVLQEPAPVKVRFPLCSSDPCCACGPHSDKTRTM